VRRSDAEESRARDSSRNDRLPAWKPDNLATIAAVAAETQFEARLANGKVEVAASLWGARHIIARHVAFDAEPLNPRNVLPAEIWKTGPHLFGGRMFVERIDTAAELSANE
jgi:hypothetical protein